MAMTINSNLKLQPTDEQSLDSEGAATLTLEWKGAYADCKSTAATIAHGETIPTNSANDGYTPSATLYTGYKAVAWSIRRGNGNTAVLTVSCKKEDTTTTSQSGTETTPFRTVYSVKSVRNDVSVLAYCGTSAANPNRAAVERWMRESDPTLASNMCYTDGAGRVVNMADDPQLASTPPLVRKIMKGVDRVIRFYPQITRKRQYYAPPSGLFRNLSYIDTPPTPTTGNTLAPDGLSTLISAHQWLKVQDDCDEQQDHTWMRTESWIGIKYTDEPDNSPWDPDLYGPNRWQMPHDATAQA